MPDTLDPRDYFPLQVGNTWEYQHSLHRPLGESERHLEYYRIVDGMVQDDTMRFVLVFDAQTDEGQPIRRDTSLIWYDETTASIEGDRLPQIISWLRCLDAPYGVIDEGPFNCWPFIERRETFVFDEMMTAKSFQNYVWAYEAVHGIGIMSGGGGCEPCTAFDDSDHWSLQDARVDGQKYGTRIARTERPDDPAVQALSVYPNPIHGQATVDVPHAGVLTVFDLLGRRVYAVETNGPGKVRLDASTLAPGLYLLQFENRTTMMMVQ